MKKYQITKIINKNILSIEKVKNFIRISEDYDDDLLKEMILTAQDIVEKFLSFSISYNEVELEINSTFHCKIYLPIKPISKILSIQKNSATGKILEDLDLKSCEIRNNKDSIIIDKALLGNNLKIIYLAGFEDVENIPFPIKQGIMLHVAAMYDKRACSPIIPEEVRALYSIYMNFKL